MFFFDPMRPDMHVSEASKTALCAIPKGNLKRAHQHVRRLIVSWLVCGRREFEAHCRYGFNLGEVDTILELFKRAAHLGMEFFCIHYKSHS